jgi:hypothetical protein
MREAYRAYKLRVPSSIPLVPASGFAPVPLTAEDDAALEARFELQRGQLAHARARASRRLVKLVRDGEVAGIGVFVASVPGSFPFRLTDPALAATFLAHLRPLAAPALPSCRSSSKMTHRCAASRCRTTFCSR